MVFDFGNAIHFAQRQASSPRSKVISRSAFLQSGMGELECFSGKSWQRCGVLAGTLLSQRHDDTYKRSTVPTTARCRWQL